MESDGKTESQILYNAEISMEKTERERREAKWFKMTRNKM